MKKFLLIVVCCILCASVDVYAKEYKEEETQECLGGYFLCDFNDNLITGIVKYRFPFFIADISYRNGRQSGKEKIYYEDGTLKSDAFYVNGELNGELREYNETGKLIRLATYKNGKLNGPHKLFYSNGNLQAEGNAENGKYEGIVRFWDETGNLSMKLYFERGIVVSGHHYKNGVEYKFPPSDINWVNQQTLDSILNEK